MEKRNRPKVGIGILIFKEGKMLLGKRLGAHAAGFYSGPGGHLEYMESFEDCARRETREETGIEIDNVKFLCLSNLKTYAPEHYVNIGLTADWKSGVPENIEPEKCAGWNWYGLEEWPPPIFDVYKNYMAALKTGQKYFDS